MSEPFAERLTDVLERAARTCGDTGENAAVRLARRLGVGAYVNRYSQDADTESPIDAERALLVLAQSLVREAAEELSAALAAGGVRHFFVKGAALADRIYGPGEREMVDIDVHVVPAAKDIVPVLLVELGYAIPPEAQQEGPAALRAGFVAERRTGSSLLERIGVDVAWGLDPVDRLLPRPDLPVPQEVWERLELTGSFPVPSAAHHVALLVHHMVHHDMFHLRGLVDLALLWPTITTESARELESLAQRLGVLRVTRLLAEVLRSEFGIELAASGPAPNDWRGRRARHMLDPVSWCAWASNATETEFVEINVRRLRRRLLLLDELRHAAGLVMDAVFPPREYLSWRWPETRPTAWARFRHLRRVVGKLA